MKNDQKAVIEWESPAGLWEGVFKDVCNRIGSVFSRSETRQRSKSYLKGLLSKVERKNGWQIAEEIGESVPYNVQYLLDRAKWCADELRDILQKYVFEKLGDENGVGVLDETGFLKKGCKSVGVQRQYSGTAGRIENCQIGVFLSYTSVFGHTLIDRELYLPKSWIESPERCREADIPEDVQFATKPELAIKMIKRVLDKGLPIAWFAGDSVYGSSRPLRSFLGERRKPYALAVSCKERVIVSGKAQRVDKLAAALAPDEWKCMSAGNGSKGPRLYNWVCIPLKMTSIKGWGHWLVCRKSLKTEEKLPEITYVLVFAPIGTTLQKMVEIIGERWTVEECFESGKGEVGLDQYEVRSWQGWYRHITLCMFALAFLVVLRASSQTLEGSEQECNDQKTPNYPSIPKESHDEIISSLTSTETLDNFTDQIPLINLLPMMVPISVPEIRQLFYYLVGSQPLSFVYRFAWSIWRRTHQAVARFYHYQRRILAAPSYLQL
jgi:SRSO17 transposase